MKGLQEQGQQATLVVVDEDRIELSNLHRQILFEDADVGDDKSEAFVGALRHRFGTALAVELVASRALPDTVESIVTGADVVIDATDNFATRFLLADAARLAGVAIVHSAAVRWHATVMAVAATGRPCYRCLFEEIPDSVVIDCATAGVMGPVCGVSGGVAADAALRILAHDDDATGRVVSFDGLTDRLRGVRVHARSDCPLCGESPTIGSIQASRYVGPDCYS